MRAVRKMASGKGNVSVVDVEEPTAGPDQVVIEVAAAGICGTDVHIVEDEFPTRPPVTLGHELAGTIAELGEGVDGWSVGDRVTSETYFYTCGRCLQCRRGRPNLCADRRSIGSKEDGAFARYLVVPSKNLLRVPDELPLEQAALTEPLACAVHGVLGVAGVTAGDRVAITGPGPIGLLTLQLVRAAGASAVMLGTHQDSARLRLASSLGADAVIDVDSVEDASGAARDALAVDGADVVIECSGAGPAASMLLDIVGKGGRYCQMGLYGKPIVLDQDVVCYKELTVTGTNASVPTAWPRALELLAGRQVDGTAIITHRFPLEHWDEALSAVRSKQGAKVILTPRNGGAPGAEGRKAVDGVQPG